MKEWTFDPKKLGYDFAVLDQLNERVILGTNVDRLEFFNVLYAQCKEAGGNQIKKDLILFVHGYNNDSETSLETTCRLQHVVGDKNAIVACIDFASLGKWWFYHPDKDIAKTCAPLIANFFKALRDNGCFPADRCHLLAHSMGNRIIELMYKKFGREENPVFGSFVSTQPDVYRRSQKLCHFHAGVLVKRTYLLYSPDDTVLNLS